MLFEITLKIKLSAHESWRNDDYYSS